MKLRKTLAAAGALAIAAGLTVVARPAMACTDPAGGDCADTTVTFVVTGGTLAFTTAPATGSLTYASTLLGGTTASGTLGDFVVEDTRNSTAGWTVSASSTAFNRTLAADGTTAVNAATSPEDDTIENTNVTIEILATNVDNALSNIVAGQTFAPVVGGTDGTGGAIGTLAIDLGVLGLNSGNNKVVYDPSVTVVIPAGSPNGTYTGVVTQTVA